MIADRDDQWIAVLRWLNAPADIISVQAEASDEAMAFLHTAVGQLPEQHRVYWESRIFVAELRRCRAAVIGLGPKLVVVLNGGVPGIAAALVEDGHHAYVACGSDVGSSPNAMRLLRPWRHTLIRELEAMGLPRLEAHRQAGLCGRSLAALRRIPDCQPRSGASLVHGDDPPEPDRCHARWSMARRSPRRSSHPRAPERQSLFGCGGRSRAPGVDVRRAGAPLGFGLEARVVAGRLVSAWIASHLRSS